MLPTPLSAASHLPFTPGSELLILVHILALGMAGLLLAMGTQHPSLLLSMFAFVSQSLHSLKLHFPDSLAARVLDEIRFCHRDTLV